MLANLDNEVHFKKVFTDVEVFTAFVKDVLGIEIEIDKVETEKVLPSKVSAIKFKMDLFAEDKKSRTIVEIQKVDYDYTYDRFSHYFLANLVDVQRRSDDYSYDREVYIIVVVTSAYKISDITGKPVKNDILITDINPRDVNGQIIKMTNHKMLILNPTYIQPNTPENVLDWLNLIRESMKNPEHPNINISKPAILRAAKLAEKEELTPEQLAESKIQNMRKKAMAFFEKQAAEALEEAQREAVEAQREAVEAQREAVEAQREAVEARKQAAEAEKQVAEAERQAAEAERQAAEAERQAAEAVAEAQRQTAEAVAVAQREAVEAQSKAVAEARRRVVDENIKKLIQLGILTIPQIALTFDVAIEYVEELVKTISNG